MRKISRNTAEVFDYLTKNETTQSNRQIIDKFLAGADAGGLTILDAGCGRGDDVFEIAALGPRAVVGVDISGESINFARRQGYGRKNTHFAVADLIEGLPFKNESFDFCSCLGVFEYIPDQIFLLEELCRTSKRKNAAILIAASKFNLKYWLPKAIHKAIRLFPVRQRIALARAFAVFSKPIFYLLKRASFYGRRHRELSLEYLFTGRFSADIYEASSADAVAAFLAAKGFLVNKAEYEMSPKTMFLIHATR